MSLSPKMAAPMGKSDGRPATASSVGSTPRCYPRTANPWLAASVIRTWPYIFFIGGDDGVAIFSGRLKPYSPNIANGIATTAVTANHLQDTSSDARAHIGLLDADADPQRMSPAAGCGSLNPGVTSCSAASLFGACIWPHRAPRPSRFFKPCAAGNPISRSN